jgi:RNA polymerase sigma-70 factor (ECF subfamily)
MDEDSRTGDAELLASWQQGDAGAFEALVRRWQGPIARFLFHFLPDSAAVADLCQETFLRLYLAKDRHRPGAGFAAFLYQTALNLARDHARRKSVRERPIPSPSRNGPSAALLAEGAEAVAAVAGAVAELPEPLRVVLVLRHYQGLSFEDIGRLLATPASTLKSRFAAALRALRPKLLPHAPQPEDRSP